MKSDTGMMTAGLSEPGALPAGIQGGLCALPGAPELRAGTGLRAALLWCHDPGGSSAQEEPSERGQPRRESPGRASRYIPGAGAEGTAWARSEGAKHKPGLAPCGPGGERGCGRSQPVPAVPARPAGRPPLRTFEALLVQHDRVVLGGLRQAEELASAEEEIGAADPKTAAVSRGRESGEEEEKKGGGGRKAGTGSAGAGRAA